MTVLTGSVGNDTYTGASGVADTAVIDSNRATATFSFDGARWTVTSSAGTDTLSSVESAQFLDGTYGLVAGHGWTTKYANTYYDDGGPKQSIARLADGGWVLTWQSRDAMYDGIFMQRFSAAGESVGSEMQVNATTDYAQTRPSSAGLTGGGYVVAWKTEGYTDPVGYQRSVVFQRYNADGNKVGGETVVDATGGTFTDLDIAGTPNGGFAATWGESIGADFTLWAQLYDSSGAKVGSALSLGTSTGYASQTNAEIVALGTGYVAVWQQTDVNGTHVFQQRVSSTGAKIGSAVQVSGDQTSSQKPVVAALEDGSYVVAWTEPNAAGQNAVFAQRFTSGGTKIGSASAINGDVPVVASSAIAAAGLEDGGFVVVWPGMQTTYPYGLYVQRFDASGSPAGPVQSLDTYVNGADPDVVSLAGGGFAVSWTHGGTVHTQRFNADGDTAVSEISGTAGNDVINFTGSTRVKLIGAAGNDSLTGGSGADVLDGGAGADTMTGGFGNDTYVWQAGDTIVELANGGIDTVKTSVSYTLGSRYLENAVLTGTAKGDLIGNGSANRLTGNAADNVLNGGGGADTLVGGAGSDTYVIDNVGDRVIEAAGGGIDTVISSVTTVLSADVEHLRLGGAAAIAGTGNALGNLITGNAYANRLDGLAGDDTLIGGLGDDTYVLQAAEVDDYREYAGEGTDTLEIDQSWVLHSALDSIENLTLREGGAFSGTGDGIANVIRGNSQANLIDGRAGADTMDGAGGDDTYQVDNAGDVAAEIGWGGVDLVNSTVTHTLGDNIENLTLLTTANLNGTGNNLGNVITGNAGANWLDGLYGADTLIGGGGNDVLTSADGFDVMAGGVGDDTYNVSSENDEIVEGAAAGTDTVFATVDRAYTLSDNIEKLRLVGEHIDGHGNTLANGIFGTDGNNLLDGGTGADTLTGMAGDDVYIVDNVGDVVSEALSGGIDEVFATVSRNLGANQENLTLGGSAALNGSGNTLANRLIGNDAANVLSGGDGADLLMGYGGADRLIGGTGADTLKGGSGNDTYDVDSLLDAIFETSTLASEIDAVNSTVNWTLGANLEKLTLLGTAAVNGAGNALRNTLVGNGAANVLDGGAGSDTLTGGAGTDTFRFTSALGASTNVDRITDFSVVDDTIQLENGIFKALLTAGALSSANLRAGAGVTTAADANDFVLYNATTGALYYDADGSATAVAAVQFATLNAGLALMAADFTII